MPVTSKTRLDLEVSAAALLTTIPIARLVDGREVFCSAAGATHGLYILDKEDNTSVVDGVNVVATDTGTGRWIFEGSPGGGSAANISVNTEALLTAFPVTDLKDGVHAWVGNPAGGVGQSQQSSWRLVTQIGAAPALVAHEVIASSAAGRVWMRLTNEVNQRWSQQAAWFVDAGAGDDQNDGLSNVTPLQSYTEYLRRTPYLYVPTTVNVLSTLPDTDNLSHEPQVRWHQALSGTYPSLSITGVRTLGANQNVASSSDETANQAPRIDAGLALTIGSIIQATSGGSSGATAVVTALIAGTNFETSPWQSAALARVAPPAPADTIAVVTLPTVNEIAIGGTELQNGPTYTNLNIKGNILTRQARWFTCTLAATASAVPVIAGGSQLFFGCGLLTSSIGTSNTGTRTAFLQCGLIRSAAGTMTWQNGAIGAFTNCVLRNWALDISGNGAGLSNGGFVSVSSLGLAAYGAAATGMKVRTGGILNVSGTLYGPSPGGGTTGTDCREQGHIYVSSNITPTLTGATELIFDGAATANAAPPLATGVIPVASALNNWGAGAGGWSAGGTFNRDVVSYRTLASINNYV